MCQKAIFSALLEYKSKPKYEGTSAAIPKN